MNVADKGVPVVRRRERPESRLPRFETEVFSFFSGAFRVARAEHDVKLFGLPASRSASRSVSSNRSSKGQCLRF